MPKATVSAEPVTCKLTKAPPDGFVILKKMSYGDTLARADLQMSAPMAETNGNREIKFETSPKDTALFDFRKCIVDHNLEDADGKKLDLTSAQGLDQLDPAVGIELSDLIDKLNSAEDMTPFLN